MKLFINCLFNMFCAYCCSQTNPHIMLQNSANKIIGGPTSLIHFFNALDSLKMDSCKTLSIVHIGDSHIQADYFSGMLRVLFQEKFGNAGRGLIFPYKIAHTNEPTNYSSSSLNEWMSARNVFNPNKLTLGISGISLYTTSNQSSFTIKVKNQNNLNYAFNTIDLFSELSSVKNTRLISSNSEMIASEQKTIPFISTFQLKDSTRSINFQFSDFNPIDIHGLLLKNNLGGIMYHSIGVNGATFKSYNDTPLFIEQLSYLKPDLIIISLGTNESYGNKFNIDEFSSQSQLFIENVKMACHSCSILLTTPPDNFKAKKGKFIHNEKPKEIGNYLKEYARANDDAVWDLYHVMGGDHSMKAWKKQNLSVKDYVHFTRKGYELQGNLLFEAIMNSYLKK